MYNFTKNLAVNLILFCALTISAISISAQTESARLQGNVTDSNGAVVAGATVKATDAGTNRTQETQTNEEGAFTFLSLKPGQYVIEVTSPNFKTTRQEITLEVAQVSNLTIALETGAVTETVNVSSDAPLIESASSALGVTINGRETVELPLNGRNVLELARLTPGVTQGVIGGFASGAGGNAETYRGGNVGGASLSVNGQRGQANNFLLDGVDNNESLVGTINNFPSADAVQEFRVQTSVATAEFGRGGGGIINSVTRSGSNNYRGSAYEYLRNNALDARPAFFNSIAAQRRLPLFRRNQFGGTVGGPVPFLGINEGGPTFGTLKDKVFFFFSYDGLRQFLPSSTDTATIPTVAFRSGNFSALNSQLRDPLDGRNICVTGTTTNGIACVNGNGTAFNRLDLLPGGNRLNQAALNYLRAFPLPNNGSQVFGNYINTREQIAEQNVFETRIDANVNESNQLFVRTSVGLFDQTTTSRLPTLPSGFGSGTNPIRTRGIVLGLNTTLTSNLFNEFRLHANRIRYGYLPPFGDQAVSANLGIVNANRSSILGGGALIGGYNGELEYTGDFGEYRVPQNTYQLVDSMAFLTGDHAFKFGTSLIKRNVQLFRPTAGKGYFRIYGNGDFDQCPGASGAPSVAASGTTGFEQADLLIGFMCSYQIGSQSGNFGTITYENGFFGQDDWKVNNRLTLNLGLRYEYFTNPSEDYGRQSNFNLQTGGLVIAQGESDTLTKTDKNNFSPRLGFAYDIFGTSKTVVRGGYGLFYFLDRGGIDNQLAQNQPFSGTNSYNYNDGFRFTLSGQAPLFSTDNRLATVPLPPPTTNLSPAFLAFPRGVDVLAVIPDNKTSNVQQFNIQVQHQLTSNTALSVGYVGTRARNLSLFYNLNRQVLSPGSSIACPLSGAVNVDGALVQRTPGNCYPGIGGVNVRDDNGRSNYDSLQVQLERRLTQGWLYRAAYTFSKLKDNGEGAFDATVGGINYIEPFATSRSDFPHVFSFATIYELPFGRGRQFGGDIPKALDYIIGGFQLNAIFRAQSGSPFDVRFNNRLANVSGDPYTGEDDTTPFIRRAAFTEPTAGTLGNLGRNSLRSPSTRQLNFGLSKNFNFTERTKLEFRADAFNVFNEIQFGTPNTNPDPNNNSPLEGFGTIRGTTPFSNRQIQFGLRLSF